MDIMESSFYSQLIDELRQTISELGKDGGIISPSIYDTAQVLRFHPPEEGIEPVIEWLLDQQQADGGWGDPQFPLTRLVPTLAAIVSISTVVQDWRENQALLKGLKYLDTQVHFWNGSLPDDIPVAAELVVPKLLHDALTLGLPINIHVYGSLIQLGKQRLKLIADTQAEAGTTASYSWEAWGEEPSLRYIDAFGSVGHSPAATASWLQKASATPALRNECIAAKDYLKSASSSTQSNIPGLYPTAWPIDRFEQAFGLHALLLTGCLHHPALADIVSKQLISLSSAFTSTGIGFSDYFEADGDDSFAAASVLISSGYKVPLDIFRCFQRDQHFTSYPNELQSSPSVTARAQQALTLAGCETHGPVQYLLKSQKADGRWTGDKWNYSWLYTTAIVLSCLECNRCDAAIERALNLILETQHAEGWWSSNGKASVTETAYGIVALANLARCGFRQESVACALERALTWMRIEFTNLGSFSSEKYWLNKELYRPIRIDKLFILGSMFSAGESVGQHVTMLSDQQY